MSEKKSFFSKLFGKKEPAKPDLPKITIPEVKITRPDDNFSAPKGELRIADVPYDDVFMRTAMLNGLSADNLTQLITQLDLDASKISGGKGRQVMAIMEQVSRKHAWHDLLAACKELNPSAKWQQE